jgi:hypothetical protein
MKSNENVLGDAIGAVELLNKHESPLLSVVNAARVSYNKQKETTSALLLHLSHQGTSVCYETMVQTSGWRTLASN